MVDRVKDCPSSATFTQSVDEGTGVGADSAVAVGRVMTSVVVVALPDASVTRIVTGLEPNCSASVVRLQVTLVLVPEVVAVPLPPRSLDQVMLPRRTLSLAVPAILTVPLASGVPTELTDREGAVVSSLTGQRMRSACFVPLPVVSD
ncbi:MAG: hypothetical protein KIT17_18410 [Rubrivivax sp.]|nr:hypothetical protein [Rubrivivax sp.]